MDQRPQIKAPGLNCGGLGVAHDAMRKGCGASMELVARSGRRSTHVEHALRIISGLHPRRRNAFPT
jgi:hypothetical protein